MLPDMMLGGVTLCYHPTNLHDPDRCDVAWYDMMWRGMAWYDMMWCDTGVWNNHSSYSSSVSDSLPPPECLCSRTCAKVSAIGLWNKHSFVLAALGHLSANFEIRGAGSGPSKHKRHRDESLFHRHRNRPNHFLYKVADAICTCRTFASPRALQKYGVAASAHAPRRLLRVISQRLYLWIYLIVRMISQNTKAVRSLHSTRSRIARRSPHVRFAPIQFCSCPERPPSIR